MSSWSPSGKREAESGGFEGDKRGLGTMGAVRVREEFINSVLADLLGEKIGEWFSIAVGEAVVRSTPRRRRKLPDVYFFEYYGVKVVFEAKVGFPNIEKAKERCRERLREGIADVCFAVAYDESVAFASNTEEIKEKLRSNPLRLFVITVANTRGVDIGEVKPDEVVSALEKHRMYDELVSKEVALELAEKLRATLNSATRAIPPQVLNSIASIAEQRLGLLSSARPKPEEGSEGEE